MPLTSFTPGQTISSSAVNANFALCVLTDTARTVTVTHIWSASQSFTGGVSVTGAITMLTAASKIIPGATSFSLRNNADSADNVLVSDAGAVTVRAGVALAGALSGATTGGFSGIVSAAGLALTGDVLFTDALYDIGKTGATRPRDGFFSRNVIVGGTLQINSTTTSIGLLTASAGFVSASYGQFYGAGSPPSTGVGFAIEIKTGAIFAYDRTGGVFGPITITATALTLAGGDVTISGGSLLLSTAVSKIIPGATSLSLRNNADSADNLIITNAGAVTVRAGLTVGSTVKLPNATAVAARNNANAADYTLVTLSSGDYVQVAPTAGSSVTLGNSTGNLGFYGATGATIPAVTGSRAGNAALASLLTKLVSLNLLTDSTTA